ncbi:hypothetical protein C8R47DRAFT_1082133 [Mycena vitilis]|nr:hypothetical protein C8R47DRAFT_1082133 [Mycena vitilis]
MIYTGGRRAGKRRGWRGGGGNGGGGNSERWSRAGASRVAGGNGRGGRASTRWGKIANGEIYHQYEENKQENWKTNLARRAAKGQGNGLSGRPKTNFSPGEKSPYSTGCSQALARSMAIVKGGAWLQPVPLVYILQLRLVEKDISICKSIGQKEMRGPPPPTKLVPALQRRAGREERLRRNWMGGVRGEHAVKSACEVPKDQRVRGEHAVKSACEVPKDQRAGKKDCGDGLPGGQEKSDGRCERRACSLKRLRGPQRSAGRRNWLRGQLTEHAGGMGCEVQKAGMQPKTPARCQKVSRQEKRAAEMAYGARKQIRMRGAKGEGAAKNTCKVPKDQRAEKKNCGDGRLRGPKRSAGRKKGLRGRLTGRARENTCWVRERARKFGCTDNFRSSGRKEWLPASGQRKTPARCHKVETPARAKRSARRQKGLRGAKRSACRKEHLRGGKGQGAVENACEVPKGAQEKPPARGEKGKRAAGRKQMQGKNACELPERTPARWAAIENGCEVQKGGRDYHGRHDDGANVRKRARAVSYHFVIAPAEARKHLKQSNSPYYEQALSTGQKHLSRATGPDLESNKDLRHTRIVLGSALPATPPGQ